MLARFTRMGCLVSPLVLGAFVMATVGWPWPAGAQEAPAPGRASRVLFVPIQRSDEVPEGVPPRVEEYLKALIEIDPKAKLISMAREEVPLPAAAPVPAPEPAPKPEPKAEAPKTSPDIEKANRLATQGREAVEAKKYEKGLPLLMQARDLYSKRLAELEDFELFADTHLWIAVAFVEGGYAEEGADALNKLVVMRPDIAFEKKDFSKRFVAAFDAAKARAKTGGAVAVTATPTDAAVYVDGRLSGQGTATVQGLPKGRHFVRVVADGHSTQGRFVTTGDKELAVAFALKSTTPAAVAAKPEKKAHATAEDGDKTLTWYARTGDYLGRFQKVARTAAEKQMADYVLLAYMGRSEASFLLGLFLFDAKTGELAWIEPAVIDTDLGNLQIALLDLESRFSAAITMFPKDRLVKAKPSIYMLVAAKPKPAPVPAPVVVAAPVPAPAPAPAPVPAPVAVAPAPAPAAAPAPAPAPAPAVALPVRTASPAPTGGFDEIPEDFPMEGTAPVSSSHTTEPWYKKWWIWTIAGAVVAGAVVTTAVMVTRSGGGGDTFGGVASW